MVKPAKSPAGICTGNPPGEDAAHRIRPNGGTRPNASGRGTAGHFRLPRLDACLLSGGPRWTAKHSNPGDGQCKRLRAKLKDANECLRRRVHLPIVEPGRWLGG